MYLLKPEDLKEAFGLSRDKVKKIAFVVYNMYKEKKSQLLANRDGCVC